MKGKFLKIDSKKLIKNIDKVDIILAGGDERIEIDDISRLNKYFVNPINSKDIFNRGSCTINGLTDFSRQVLTDFLGEIGNKHFTELRNNHVKRLKKLINFSGEDKFDLIFAPSGSDLVYIPYLFAQIRNPRKPIVNFLSCPEELGSGTIIGAEGNFFMSKNQFGETIVKNSKVSPHISSKVISFTARDKQGNIISHKRRLKKIIEDYHDYAKVGSLVVGSKSGIEDNIDIIEQINTTDIQWVVDLCQFRNRKGLINRLLDMGCMVMITGSKFFQSPPFSGAMLVPKGISKNISSRPVKALEGYDKIFSKYDFPEELTNIRKNFRSFENFGLLARWECGISEMELFDDIPSEKTNALLSGWNKLMCSLLWNANEYFELMPNMELTNKSIISFRVKKNGEFLDYETLRSFFSFFVKSEIRLDRFKRIFIGQPVKYGDKAFLRLAIGSYNIRKLLEKPKEIRFENDKRLIHILIDHIEKFN